MTDERIKELSVAELDEISLGESVDMLRTPDRISMLAFRMSEEIRRRRAEAVAMRPVVEAARALRRYDASLECGPDSLVNFRRIEREHRQAVDAYEAAIRKDGAI